jgi:septum formation protein
MAEVMRLILASNSPRRRELLSKAGLEFDVRSSSIEEYPGRGERPEEYARRMAREKTLSVAAVSPAESLVLGADTVVAVGNDILGKPVGPFDATRTLRTLSGQTHRVITAVCLVRAPERVEAWTHETTFVTFCQLTDDEIRNYVASGEPFGKAGAYAIQGLASRFVTHIEGCYFNAVGLPVALVYEILKNLQPPLLALLSTAATGFRE